MPRIKIENATVTKVLAEKGFWCEESYTTKDGEEKKTKFTVWCKAEDIPGEGSLINVEGLPSPKVESFTDQMGNPVTYGKIHVNFPRITLLEAPQEPVVQQAPENWSTALSTEAPF